MRPKFPPNLNHFIEMKMLLWHCEIHWWLFVKSKWVHRNLLNERKLPPFLFQGVYYLGDRMGLSKINQISYNKKFFNNNSFLSIPSKSLFIKVFFVDLRPKNEYEYNFILPHHNNFLQSNEFFAGLLFQSVRALLFLLCFTDEKCRRYKSNRFLTEPSTGRVQ